MAVSMKRENMSRRSFLKIAGVSAGALALAACAAPASAPAGEAGAGAAPGAAMGTVEFLAWGDVVDTAAWQTLAQNFMDQNEGVEVAVTDVPDPANNFYTKLQTMIAGGTPPNLASFQGWEWQTYADRDLLVPIDEWVTDAGLESMYIDVPTVDVSTVRNGKRYLIPMQVATMVMFYAKKPFDDAGIPYPTDDWTMEDMISIAEQLTDTSGDSKMFGYQANGIWARDIQFIRTTGEQEFDEIVDPRAAQFNQPAIVDMLQLVAQDVYYSLGISPTPADMEGGANTIDTGNAAMKYEGAWYLARLNSPAMREQGTQVEFDVVMMPQGADSTRPHRGWAEGLAVPKSDNEAGGWALAAYMGGPEGDRIYSEITGRIPNSLDLIENFWIPNIQEQFGVSNGAAFLEGFRLSEVDVISGVPRSKMWAEVIKPNGYDPLTNNSATAAEVLPAVDEALQALLDDYWASQG